jgi:hypothetical protein
MQINTNINQRSESPSFIKKLIHPYSTQNLEGIYYANDYTVATIASNLDSNTHLIVGINGQLQQKSLNIKNDLLDNS